MPWQDWVFSIGGFVILISLIPTIRGDQKPALTTSVMSLAIISIFAVTMATLGLWLSASANAGVAAAWGVMAVQRYQMIKRQRNEGVLAQIEEEVIDVTLGLDDDDEAIAVAQPGKQPV
ncbi:MAG: hypothetical protein GEU75_06000 [Dehalococcoidia bacterium]|nr:hypothetical protein [Dehalococcoidia bacterium]